MAKDQDAPIKLPVRYDKKGQCIRHGNLGSVLVSFPFRFAADVDDQNRVEEETHERGEYIATCINDHARLQQQAERLTKALEHYADERRWSAAMLEPGRWTIAKVQLHGGDNGYDLARQVLDEAKEKK